MGYVGWLGNFSEQDAVLAAILRKAGAVFYVRTNVPQTLMCGETINNIFGRTLNPANRKLTSGGSSGGEGALIALKGSPLGVGSDIGGSIRIPAGFNGLYGLRPTVGFGHLLNVPPSHLACCRTIAPLTKARQTRFLDSRPYHQSSARCLVRCRA